jgi:hypothetical protein
MHGFESGPDWQTPECPLWDLVRGFLKAAKVLRLNNPDGAASDESIQEAVRVKLSGIDTIVNDVKFFAHKLRKW